MKFCLSPALNELRLWLCKTYSNTGHGYVPEGIFSHLNFLQVHFDHPVCDRVTTHHDVPIRLHPGLLQPHAATLKGHGRASPVPHAAAYGALHFPEELAMDPWTIVIMDDMQASRAWWAPAPHSSPIINYSTSMIHLVQNVLHIDLGCLMGCLAQACPQLHGHRLQAGNAQEISPA